MRVDNRQQAGLYSYISAEQRVTVDHPWRPMTDEVFKQLSSHFDKLYSRGPGTVDSARRLRRPLSLQMLYFGAQRTDVD